jgi:DNA-binding transcriptional regulator PaaX
MVGHSGTEVMLWKATPRCLPFSLRACVRSETQLLRKKELLLPAWTGQDGLRACMRFWIQLLRQEHLQQAWTGREGRHACMDLRESAAPRMSSYSLQPAGTA